MIHSDRSRHAAPAWRSLLLLAALLLVPSSAFTLQVEAPPGRAPRVEAPVDAWRGSLHQAVYASDLERVRALIRAGADVNERLDGDGMIPLQYAVAAGSMEALEILLAAGAEINGTGGGGDSPLMHAAAAARASILGRLLDLGADVSTENGIGWTPLMHAAGIPHSRLAAFRVSEAELDDMVRRLLDAGAAVNVASDNRGETALILAAQEGHGPTVTSLLAAGADLDQATSIDRMTSLMLAADGGHLDVVERLLEAGADVDLRDRLGRTAGDWAADHPEVVARLTAAGVPSRASKQGLQEVAPEARAEAVEALTQLGYDLTELSFFHAVMEADLPAIRQFLAAGMSPDTRDEAMARPLLRATAFCGHAGRPFVEIALALIAADADVNVRDVNGATPLIHAAQSCPLTVVEALLAAGADVDARAAGGATPLMMARVMKRERIAAALEAAGASEP